MPTPTRKLIGAVAIPALVFGLAACGADDADSNGSSDELKPHDMVLASYDDLSGSSYKMESDMTVNGLDFMDITSVSDGESAQSTQDMYMSAILETMGEELPDDPEMAEMMEAMFADMHTESIVVDDVIYMQFTGGMFDTIAEQAGADAWFTVDLTEEGDLSDLYAQFGSFDLAEQTEMILGDLSDVEETGDGVYSGTLNGDSEAMQSMLGATGGAGMADAEAMIDEIDVVITLDDQDLLKSIEMTLPEMEGMNMAFISEVVEIGGDYEIAAPESDNLHSFEDLMGMMQ